MATLARTIPREIGGQMVIHDFESKAGIREMTMQLAPAETEARPEARATDVSKDFIGPPSLKQANGRRRNYLLGTGIFKIGMESLGVSVPLLAIRT